MEYCIIHAQLCSAIVSRLNNVSSNIQEVLFDLIINICAIGSVKDNGWCTQLLAKVCNINDQQLNEQYLDVILAALNTHQENLFPITSDICDQLQNLILNQINASTELFYQQIYGIQTKIANQCNNFHFSSPSDQSNQKQQELAIYNHKVDQLQELCYLMTEKQILQSNTLEQIINMLIAITNHPNTTFLDLCSRYSDIVTFSYQFIFRLIDIYTRPFSLSCEVWQSIEDDEDSMLSDQNYTYNEVDSNYIVSSSQNTSENIYFDASKWTLEVSSEFLITLTSMLASNEAETIRAISIHRKTLMNVVMLCLNSVKNPAKSALGFLIQLHEHQKIWDEVLYYHFRGRNCLADVLIKQMKSVKLSHVSFASLIYESSLLSKQYPTQFEIKTITEILCSHMEIAAQMLQQTYSTQYKELSQDSKERTFTFGNEDSETMLTTKQLQGSQQGTSKQLNEVIDTLKSIIKIILHEYGVIEIVFQVLENANNFMANEFLDELRENQNEQYC